MILSASQFHIYFPWINVRFAQCLKCESGSSHFQPGKCPSRGLLRDYKPLNLTARPGQPEPPSARLGLKWGKWVARLSDFGKYKGYFKNHTTSQPAYLTRSKSLPTLSQVRGCSSWPDPAVVSSSS